MATNGHPEIERWRAAEATRRETEAEAALTALLARLPQLEPRPGFAARVARTAAAEAAARARARAVTVTARGPAWRWVAAAAVALVAGGLVLLAGLGGPLAGSIGGRLSLAALIDGLSGALTAMAGWLSGAFGVWELLADVGGAVAAAAGTGPVAASMLAGLAVAALALRWLSALIATERSWSHVLYPG